MTNRELLAWLAARTERCAELERAVEESLSLSAYYSRRIDIAQRQADEAEAAGDAGRADEFRAWVEVLIDDYCRYNALADARCTEALRMLELNQQIREALSPRTKNDLRNPLHSHFLFCFSGFGMKADSTRLSHQAALYRPFDGATLSGSRHPEMLFQFQALSPAVKQHGTRTTGSAAGTTSPDNIVEETVTFRSGESQ